MNFTKETIQNIVIVISVIIVCYMAIVGFKCMNNNKEYFSTFDSSSYSSNSLCKNSLTKYYFTTDQNNLKFTGMLFKNFNNNKYTYLYKFNLPIPYGGDYNYTDYQYCVYASSGKNKKSKKIGHLRRGNDGWFYLQHFSKNNFYKTSISFESKKGEDKKILFKKTLE